LFDSLKIGAFINADLSGDDCAHDGMLFGGWWTEKPTDGPWALVQKDQTLDTHYARVSVFRLISSRIRAASS
jgi:hypothetical protein